MIGKWIEVEAPANIALIKYWGKKDEDLIIPLNDSVSLSVNCLCARTRIEIVQESGHDSVTINGKSVQTIAGSRFEQCFNEARRLVRKRRKDDKNTLITFSFNVNSTTTFPVAAGLASSAAGFAAIAFALGKLLNFSDIEVSRIARIGSGSACRSVGEGLVHWHAGVDPSGNDCISETVFPQSYWPELRAIIIVLNDKEKETGSTVGMRSTVATSELLKFRVDHVVPNLTTAFEERDFAKLATIIMADSNQFHAVCLDTFPPLRYMTDASFEIVRRVNDFNSENIRAAYTFDAGPNACIFIKEEDVVPCLSKVALIDPEAVKHLTSQGNWFAPALGTCSPDIKSIILSSVGMGPRIISNPLSHVLGNRI